MNSEKREITIQNQLSNLQGLLNCFPKEVIRALVKAAQKLNELVYIVGGPVRDWLLGRNPHDIDLTIAGSAESFCRELMKELGGGTVVPLGTAEDDASRLVWKGLDIDVSSFRAGSSSIEKDLRLRDFSINSLALDLIALSGGTKPCKLIDPMDGLADLKKGLLCHCPGSFQDDPLRLLRAYRFMAALGFLIDSDTYKAISEHTSDIGRISAERILYELNLIMRVDNCAKVLWEMHKSNLLQCLLPELYEGVGVEQPDFHHLDVFHHNFQALRELEKLLEHKEDVYPQLTENVIAYLENVHVRICLKWAALFHDVGKPATAGVSDTDSNRVTFHAHDEVGRKKFDALARRLKWSNDERERTAGLISMHMHPFHLCNVLRNQKLSARAALRLCRRAGADLPGLFLLAMADSLASEGEMKPEKMEDELVHLYNEVETIYKESIQPALAGPPLLRGNDIIEQCNLKPGPFFSTILDELQNLQVEGKVRTREDALEWLTDFVAEQKGKYDTKQR